MSDPTRPAEGTAVEVSVDGVKWQTIAVSAVKIEATPERAAETARAMAADWATFIDNLARREVGAVITHWRVVKRPARSKTP